MKVIKYWKFLKKWLMFCAFQCSRGIWTTSSVTCLSFWLALAWSGSWTWWFLFVLSDWTVLCYTMLKPSGLLVMHHNCGAGHCGLVSRLCLPSSQKMLEAGVVIGNTGTPCPCASSPYELTLKFPCSLVESFLKGRDKPRELGVVSENS